MQGDFSQEFERLRQLGSEVFVLRGSVILVEILPPEELKTEGGLVFVTDSNQIVGGSLNQHRLEVGRVLMTGPGYWDEEKKEYEPLEVKPGAIIILPQFSTQYISQFPGLLKPTCNRLATVRMDQVVGYYPTEEAYQRAKSVLNQK